MKKRVIIIVSIIIVLVIGIFMCIKFIPNKKMLYEEKTVHDIKFSDVKLTKKGDKYIFNVSLTTDKELNVDNFDANFKDKKGNSLAILRGSIGSIKKGDIVNVEIETPKDLKDAYEITYTVNAK